MQKSVVPKDFKVYLPLIALFAVIFLSMPRSGKFNYDYRKGSPWAYENLVAGFDFPILKTAEQLQAEREAAGSSVVPYYRYMENMASSVLKSVEDLDADPALKQAITAVLTKIYSHGIVGGMEEATEEAAPASDDDIIFVQRDKRATKVPASDVYTISSSRAHLLSEIARDFPALNADSLFAAEGIYDIIKPDLVFDKETTDLVHAEAVDYISPTTGYMNAGQTIVTKGEIVTAEIQQMLDSYKAEYGNSLGYGGPMIKLWIGNGILAFAIALILFLSIFYTNPLVFKEWNRYLYLCFVLMAIALVTMAMEKMDPDLLYLTPFSLAALFLLAFFKKRVVLPVYVISLLPLLIFGHNGIELYVMYMVAGVVTMYVFEYFNRGWRQFVTAVIVFAALALTYTGFRFIDDSKSFADISKLVYLFLGSMLSVAGYPLIYLFEKMFGLVSNSRLMELCDTNNNKLLIELAQKAPGTFQHSLQVMNMADAAAKSIDANVLLVRAGALYHDVGKMLNPQCFVENEALGARYHEGLSPQESARDIIRHVPDGLCIAERNKLPQVVKDFILSHHGTSCTGYFYNKYLNAGGDPAGEAAFRYSGFKPLTKEQTIVMLCDSLEAASRTLKDNKPETFNAFVEKIVEQKISGGQLDNADISLKELETVKSVLKTYLRQIYHERVVYPKRS